MSSSMVNQPALIMKEGSSRSQGREAQHANIMAALAVAESVRSSLGPKGMDKMLVDGFGDVTISNDGATILDEMDVQHPAGKTMVEVATASLTSLPRFEMDRSSFFAPTKIDMPMPEALSLSASSIEVVMSSFDNSPRMLGPPDTLRQIEVSILKSMQFLNIPLVTNRQSA